MIKKKNQTIILVWPMSHHVWWSKVVEKLFHIFFCKFKNKQKRKKVVGGSTWVNSLVTSVVIFSKPHRSCSKNCSCIIKYICIALFSATVAKMNALCFLIGQLPACYLILFKRNRQCCMATACSKIKLETQKANLKIALAVRSNDPVLNLSLIKIAGLLWEISFYLAC